MSAASSNASVHDAASGPSLAPTADLFRAIVHDHFDFIWRLLHRLGVPPADVDDAVQQVFLVAADRLDTIVKGSERAFLYGTALRVASTHRRTASRRRKGLDQFLWETHASALLPDEELERREAIALLDEVLSGFADEWRRVFVLCDIEGLSAREVASLESIPMGTVASRLRRARELFAERVRELQIDNEGER